MAQVENPPFCNYIFNYCLIINIVENFKNSCKLFFAIGKCFSQLQTSKVDKYKSKVSLQSKVFATCQYHINSHYLPFKLQNVLPIQLRDVVNYPRMVDEFHLLIGHDVNRHLVVILIILDVCKLECLSSSEVTRGFSSLNIPLVTFIFSFAHHLLINA